MNKARALGYAHSVTGRGDANFIPVCHSGCGRGTLPTSAQFSRGRQRARGCCIAGERNATDGSPPSRQSTIFRLTEDVRVQTHEGKWVEGSYTLIWAGPHRWKDELTFSDYHEVRVGGEQSFWRIRNQPARTEVAVRAWSVVTPPRIPGVKPNGGHIKRIYETRVREMIAKCVVAEPFQSHWVEYCFDAEKGLLVHRGTKDPMGIQSTDFDDYLSLGGKFLPRQRRDFRRNSGCRGEDPRCFYSSRS